MANANAAAVAAIQKAAAKYGLDPQAMIAVARVESGLNPKAIGDGGHAFGLFQFNNAGGVITGHPNPEKYLDPGFNAMEAARHIASIKGAKGAKGAAAVKLIVNQFERPANKGAEISKALSYLGEMPPAPTVSTPTQTAPKRSLQSVGTGGQVQGSSPLQALLQTAMAGSAPDQSSGDPSGDLLPTLMQMQQGEQAPAPTVGQGAAPVVGKTKKVPANSTIVGAAQKFLGTPYLWGGTTAKGLDCSGLVQLAVKNATGKTIPRVASDQYKASTKVKAADMQPGDIIAFGTPSNVHHIGIYVGDGKFINAPHTGAKVRIDDLSGRDDVVGAGRFGS